jgi:hypothetical protein
MTLRKRSKVSITRLDHMAVGKLKRAWWTDYAQPDQREAFMAAARQRDAERAIEAAAIYPRADGKDRN